MDFGKGMEDALGFMFPHIFCHALIPISKYRRWNVIQFG
jgi:hypothetical protein